MAALVPWAEPNAAYNECIRLVVISNDLIDFDLAALRSIQLQTFTATTVIQHLTHRLRYVSELRRLHTRQQYFHVVVFTRSLLPSESSDVM